MLTMHASPDDRAEYEDILISNIYGPFNSNSISLNHLDLLAQHLVSADAAQSPKTELCKEEETALQSSAAVGSPAGSGVSNHVDESRDDPNGTKGSGSNWVSKAGEQERAEEGRLILDVVSVSTLGAVESIRYMSISLDFLQT
jgi:hypothetical protein